MERTTAGKVYAREHNPNYCEGRPRKNIIYEKNKGESVSDACKRLGISRTQWYRVVGNHFPKGQFLFNT